MKDTRKEEIPQKYPSLTKPITPLELNSDKALEITKLAFRLERNMETSIYKLLYRSNDAHLADMRSKYLKSLVESNERFFPQELLNKKLRRIPAPKDQRSKKDEVLEKLAKANDARTSRQRREAQKEPKKKEEPKPGKKPTKANVILDEEVDKEQDKLKSSLREKLRKVFR